jgi:hypothetical protein
MAAKPWLQISRGLACKDCWVKRNLLVIHHWRPSVYPWERERRPQGTSWVTAHCLNRATCAARQAKRQQRVERRSVKFVLAEPAAPDAPFGSCRWCGEKLTGENASRRNYCYADREGRDCVANIRNSTTWEARVAVRHRDFAEHGRVFCADCGAVCEEPRADWAEHPLRVHGTAGHVVLVEWEADHQHALEDGGEHTLENLRARCCACHRRKSARESAARAVRRSRPPAARPLRGGA